MTVFLGFGRESRLDAPDPWKSRLRASLPSLDGQLSSFLRGSLCADIVLDQTECFVMITIKILLLT